MELARANVAANVGAAAGLRVDAREAPFFADLENLFDRVAFTAPEAVPAEWRGTGLHLCRATGRRQT